MQAHERERPFWKSCTLFLAGEAMILYWTRKPRSRFWSMLFGVQLIRLAMNRSGLRNLATPTADDKVDLAGELSFPASDAPAY